MESHNELQHINKRKSKNKRFHQLFFLHPPASELLRLLYCLYKSYIKVSAGWIGTS